MLEHADHRAIVVGMDALDTFLSARKAFRSSDAIDAGVSRRRLAQAAADGAIAQPVLGKAGKERGIWVASELMDDPDMPEAVVCLITGGVLCRGYAAARLGLTTDLPGLYEVVMPYGHNLGARDYIRLHRTKTPAVMEDGVDARDTAFGVPIRMTSPARTVVDLLRSGTRVGEERRFGLEALRNYVGAGHDLDDLMSLALRHDAGAARVIETAAEALQGGMTP